MSNDRIQTVAVLIPVYKTLLQTDELISLNQCLSVLRRHPIVFVGPDVLECGFYISVCEKYKVDFEIELFDGSYFQNISGYNRLLLSETFYRRFSKYEYILIYQLDAFVFKDDLLKWCNRGFDYIGAPIIGRFQETVYRDTMHQRVGNGGLSLRKIKTYLSFFEGKRLIFPPKQISSRISLWEKPYTRFIVFILMCMGWKNKPKSFAVAWRYNEDDFWSGALDGTIYGLKKPSPEEAALFAFEKYPSVLLSGTGKLPFGCHAWRKYEYETFWIKYIHCDNETFHHNHKP